MEKDRRLVTVTAKDCRWDYYVGSGAGGQKKNKTANCCRCTHTDSGAVGKSEEGRSQRQNREKAFKRMTETPAFQAWIKLESLRALGIEDEISKRVDRELKTNVKVEVQKDGKWEEEK